MATGDPSGKQTNVRLSPLGRRLLEGLSEVLGLTHRDVIELSLRRLAREEGLWEPRSLTDARKGSRRRPEID